MLTGRIVKNISNSYTILSNKKEYICTPRGKFRHEKQVPLVGDICEFDEENLYILKILPRKNNLQRPSVANIDGALIITSMKKPDFNALLLDKELVSVIKNKIEPVIVFTKIDLLEEKEEYRSIKNYYEKIGISCFENTDTKEILEFLKGKFVVLTGQTGAGKSTFLNYLSPNLNLKTDEISASLNRGKHTTRHSEFFCIHDVYFCDTPGFSSLELNYSKEEIRDCFVEFSHYTCRFQDCLHLKEIGCVVKEKVQSDEIMESRYESYKKIIEELKK